MDPDTITIVYMFFAGLVIGIVLGLRVADLDWSNRGDDGYPRKEFRGKLYWVSRDDHPCFRCSVDRRRG